MMVRLLATALAVSAIAMTPALVQEKPTVSNYLNEGYEVIRADFGFAFQFMLKKDKTIVVHGAGSERRDVELPHHQVM